MAKSWAIVIGINHYDHLQSLYFAERDAQCMGDFLKQELDFNTIFLFTDNSPAIAGKSTRPTLVNLLKVLDEVFAQPFMGAGDNFWFFFSGHGISRNGRDYLMPADGYPGNVERTAIDVNYISDRLRRCGADNVVMILDACRQADHSDRNSSNNSSHQSEQVIYQIDNDIDEGISRQSAEVTHQTGIIGIFSCSPNQHSYEIDDLKQGAFTYALLEGLGSRGQCATVERLNQYLNQRVPELVSQHKRGYQTPFTIVEPAAKLHLILNRRHATLADIAVLKNDAYQAELHQDYALAQQLWICVLTAASGQDMDAIQSLKRLARHLKELQERHSLLHKNLQSLQREHALAKNATVIRRLREQIEQVETDIDEITKQIGELNLTTDDNNLVLQQSSLSLNEENLSIHNTEDTTSHRLSQQNSSLYVYKLLASSNPQNHQQYSHLSSEQAQLELGRKLHDYVLQLTRLDTSFPISQLDRLNPTLLSHDESVLAIVHYTRMVGNSGTLKLEAQNFLKTSYIAANYRSYKDSLYDYLITSLDPKFREGQFGRSLRDKIQNTLSQRDAQKVNNELLLSTCIKLLDFLVVGSSQNPQHFVFVNLISNNETIDVVTLLLKITLLSPASRLSLEKRFAILLNHYHNSQVRDVQWLLKPVDHLAMAFWIYDSKIDIPTSQLQILQSRWRIPLQGTSAYLAPASEQTTVVYDLFMSISANIASIGQELEVTIELNPSNNANNGVTYLLEVPMHEASGSELNILLNTSGLRLEGDSVASLPLDLSDGQSSAQTQTARFRLMALCPGTAKITAELYRGDTFETTLEATIQVVELAGLAAFDQPINLSPRPVPQPDLTLRIQTVWNETLSACSFRYHLDSFHPRLPFASEMQQQSEALTAGWLAQTRSLLQSTLDEAASSLPEDFRARLTSLGQYLFQHLLPLELQTTFRSVMRFNQPFTLLILTDQDAGLPWELLHNGQSFWGERFIIGRWSWELEQTRPYEFAIGAVNLAHYAEVEQPEPWASLLEPVDAPPPMLLSDGVLADLRTVEAMRGLHLLRRGKSVAEADRQDAPVPFDQASTESLEQELQPAKLSLRRNRPLVTLGYVSAGLPELTALEQTWAPTFIRSGCSAFVGSRWAVQPATEAAFISSFYHRLWAGDSLGMAFQAGRRAARSLLPDSLDWLASKYRTKVLK